MTVAGEDRVEGGNTVLRARIDLRHVALGAILIGLRPADWTYYPMRLILCDDKLPKWIGCYRHQRFDDRPDS